jgi:hypothetical protein
VAKEIAAAYRAQADAAEIEAAAKRRLADEYDAEQARDEVAKKGRPKNVPDGTLSRQRISELVVDEWKDSAPFVTPVWVPTFTCAPN